MSCDGKHTLERSKGAPDTHSSKIHALATVLQQITGRVQTSHYPSNREGLGTVSGGSGLSVSFLAYLETFTPFQKAMWSLISAAAVFGLG